MARLSHPRARGGSSAPGLATALLWAAAVCGLALLPAAQAQATPQNTYYITYGNPLQALKISVYKGFSWNAILAANDFNATSWDGSSTLATRAARRFTVQNPTSPWTAGDNTWYANVNGLTTADPGPFFCYSVNTNNGRMDCAAFQDAGNLEFDQQKSGSVVVKNNTQSNTFTATRVFNSSTAAPNGIDILLAYGTDVPVCEVDNSCGGSGSDPHVVGFNGAKYEFANGPEFQGLAYGLMSSRGTALNALVERHAGSDEFPAAGSWLTGLGLRTRGAAAGASDFTLMLRMKTSTPFDLIQDGGKTRALHPDGPKGRLAALFEAFEVNGRPSLNEIESGDTLEFPKSGVTVHLPAERHGGDSTDGPIAVINTPDMVLEWYVESEDIWHMDFKVSLKKQGAAGKMHGILGQSLHWARGAPAAKEGGDLDYVLPDGLLGTDFRYSRFGREEIAASAADPARRLLSPTIRPPLVAGSVEALEAL
ncbi:MAG: hypothetical protein J3K34DRAFT_521313 [Monoraphidium minutum]|nr:MAG: hypothetical protein J3K34DRAFT_521313 [Monoraphidium minutum]